MLAVDYYNIILFTFLVSLNKLNFQKRFVQFWIIGGSILSASYCGVIFKHMTQLSPPPKITSLTQLAYAVKNNGYVPLLIKASPSYNILKVCK